MSESTVATTAPAAAGTGQGIAQVGQGQPDGIAKSGSVGPTSPSEQPRSTTAETTAEQPQGAQAAEESSVGWKSMQDAERDYKALQREYTRITQGVKQLGDVNALRQSQALLNELSQNPRFLSWIQAEMAQEQAGSPDPDTQRALQIVDERAQAIAAQAMAPLYQAHIQQKADAVFKQLDAEVGPEWQQLKPKMLEIYEQGVRNGVYNPQVEYNFDYNFVKSLYAAAVAGDPQFAAKAYEKRLAAKQANTTANTAGAAPAAVGSGPIRSIRDAYAAALRQHGGS